MVVFILLQSNTWISYSLFSTLCFIEQIGMLTSWLLVENDIIPYYPLIPGLGPTASNTTMYNTTTSADLKGPFLGFIPTYEFLIVFVHCLLFAISILFMILTFCCDRYRKPEDKNELIVLRNHFRNR